MAKPTGGSAFPGVEVVVTGIDSDGVERYDTEATGGMTLREYYAGKALAGITANPNFFGSKFQQNPLGAAQFAVECADFLLEELSRMTP